MPPRWAGPTPLDKCRGDRHGDEHDPEAHEPAHLVHRRQSGHCINEGPHSLGHNKGLATMTEVIPPDPSSRIAKTRQIRLCWSHPHCDVIKPNRHWLVKPFVACLDPFVVSICTDDVSACRLGWASFAIDGSIASCLRLKDCDCPVAPHPSITHLCRTRSDSCQRAGLTPTTTSTLRASRLSRC